ncbi:zinc finger BED domain-containing protein RICESLEEPER 2-like [Canna indica]|uniref:Zinc finger BED domain-containing protein RICESLEEPER 2-like n=1 Tax=Canna indica TaxID=4628 RepID=A0AAQ3QA77_9LILI|nr:zinc finger BED domain-containing protein RICESLEEPER 2-like [Canna indica]
MTTSVKDLDLVSKQIVAFHLDLSFPNHDGTIFVGLSFDAPKGPKQRSKVWEYFEVYVDKEKGDIKSRCKYCQKEYAADTKKNGTSALNYHVKTYKKIPGNEDKTQSQLSLQPSGDDESTDGLKDLDPAIRWVREAVKYIRSSPARLKKFKECADSVQVESEKYEKAFERFELEDLYFEVEVDANSKGFVDWDVVRRTITMLGLFYDTIIRVSGSLYVTSNIFWTEISDLLSAILEWTRSDDSNVKGMGTKMKTKFDKYWGNVDRMNKIIFFVVVLDPREKFMAIEVSFCDIYGENEGTELFERVKISLYDIFKEYKNMLQIESGHSSETSPSSTTSSNESVGNRPRGHYKLIVKKRRIESGHVHAKSELDMYLDEALQEDKNDFDILKSSLTPKVVESLICAQDWIRMSNGLNVEEDITEVEKFENGEKLRTLRWLTAWLRDNLKGYLVLLALLPLIFTKEKVNAIEMFELWKQTHVVLGQDFVH